MYKRDLILKSQKKKKTLKNWDATQKWIKLLFSGFFYKMEKDQTHESQWKRIKNKKEEIRETKYFCG